MKPKSEKVFKVVDYGKFIIYKVNPNMISEFIRIVERKKYFLSPTHSEIIFKGTSKHKWFMNTFGEFIDYKLRG